MKYIQSLFLFRHMCSKHYLLQYKAIAYARLLIIDRGGGKCILLPPKEMSRGGGQVAPLPPVPAPLHTHADNTTNVENVHIS